MSVYAGAIVAYLSGMGVYLTTGIGFASIFMLCFITLTAVGVILKRYAPVRLCYAVFFLLGAVLLSFGTEPKANVFDEYIDRYIEIEGVICEVPDQYEEYYSYVVRTDKITYLKDSTQIDEKIRVTSKIKLDVGNRVAFRGFVNTISAPDNSTEFDYKTYYKAKAITYKMHADEAELKAGRAFILSLPYIAEYVKGRISQAIDRNYRNNDAAMLKAVMFGNKSEFTEDFEDTLVQTSAIRFLYPSYLQVFLMVAVCQFLFVAIKQKKREQLTVIVLILFLCFNSDFVTVVRAGILFIADLLLRRKRGFSRYMDRAAAMILIMLLAKPLLIYSSGFVMSVVIGFLLHFFRLPLAACFKGIKSTRIRTLLSVCIIGTVGLLPLSAYYYNGAPLYSIIFTFIYTPFTLLLFVTAPVALLLEEVFGGTSMFGVIVDGILEIMQNLPTIVSLIPGHYITLARTSVLGFLICIAICYFIKLVIDERFKEPIFKITLSAIAVLIIIGGMSALADFGKLIVTFPNVGQGDAAILEIKGKSTVLIDGGGGVGEEEYNIGEKVYLPYLIAKGHNVIDLAIVSHSHRDHTEGIIAAINALKVHTVMLSDTAEDNDYRNKIIEAAEENGTEILLVSAGDRIEFNSGLVIEVIYPAQSAKIKDENDYSLALIAEYKGTRLFFGGDITDNAEKNIEGMIGKVDVVKVSHHGSDGSSRKAFIEETLPRYAVFSVGKNNSYGHPSERVVLGFMDENSKILRTDLMNDIVLKCYGDGRIGAGWYEEELRWR